MTGTQPKANRTTAHIILLHHLHHRLRRHQRVPVLSNCQITSDRVPVTSLRCIAEVPTCRWHSLVRLVPWARNQIGRFATLFQFFLSAVFVVRLHLKNEKPASSTWLKITDGQTDIMFCSNRSHASRARRPEYIVVRATAKHHPTLLSARLQHYGLFVFGDRDVGFQPMIERQTTESHMSLGTVQMTCSQRLVANRTSHLSSSMSKLDHATLQQ